MELTKKEIDAIIESAFDSGVGWGVKMCGAVFFIPDSSARYIQIQKAIKLAEQKIERLRGEK
jgi:hypothetical protein